jgi:hypothetical protein
VIPLKDKQSSVSRSKANALPKGFGVGDKGGSAPLGNCQTNSLGVLAHQGAPLVERQAQIAANLFKP